MSEENGPVSQEEEKESPPAAAASGIPVVELRTGDKVLKVRVIPPSIGLRYEIGYAILKSDIKTGCCALGLCSPTIRKHVPFRHDVLEFGAKVLDWLLEQGFGYLDIRNAAIEVYNLLTDDILPRAAEVDAVEDFTEAAEATSTS